MEYQVQENKEAIKNNSSDKNDTDVNTVQESVEDDLENIIVLVGEFPLNSRNNIYAPIFMADRSKIFGTKTDLSFKWVGYKLTTKFRQNKFPWKSASLNEIVIGSFLHASGTNMGFNRGRLEEENRFYTNYTSEIITLKQKLPNNCAISFTLDSRQYFFVERDIPQGFVMPLNHINIFPRLDFDIDLLKESGIDQLTDGFKLSFWAGYGIRNRWEPWGEPGDMKAGEKARTFLIHSTDLSFGWLFKKHHNLVLRTFYKGGIDNDFISRPRFGGTIDNAKLDVVHGFSLDRFRVEEFLLINSRYGFDILKRLRINVFFDFANVIKPDHEIIFGSGWGIRILSFGGMPVWLTHGIGMEYHPERKPVEHAISIMTAAGW